MDYFKLLAGLALLIIFGWLLARNYRRKGFINGLFAFDTLLGFIAGLYLVITSINVLWS